MTRYERKLYMRLYRKNLMNRQKDRIRGRNYYNSHKTEKQIYYQQNKDRILKIQSKYEKRNKAIILEHKRIYQLNKRKTNIEYKLSQQLRTRLRIAIKNNQKRGSAVKDLGCSVDFFKQYVESKFYDNMTWDNYGKVWELDHIVPLWNFNLSNRKHLLKAVHYTNLQPLTIEDHKKKTIKELRRK